MSHESEGVGPGRQGGGPQALPPARSKAPVPVQASRRTYSRGYLPHVDAGDRAQFITFGLADAITPARYHRWNVELAGQPWDERCSRLLRRVEDHWDDTPDSRLLENPPLAAAVAKTIEFDANRRYTLHAWVVMPSHVHVLLTPLRGCSLAQITRAMKGVSARRVNELSHRTGRLWLRESWDRYIRGPAHFRAVWQYIEYNPVKAGLCSRPEEWGFGSAFAGGRGSQAGAPAAPVAGFPSTLSSQRPPDGQAGAPAAPVSGFPSTLSSPRPPDGQAGAPAAPVSRFQSPVDPLPEATT